MKTKKLELKNQIKELKKTVAMKCLDCINCQPKEILKCEITGCPLWKEKPKKLEGLYILVKQLKKKNLSFYEEGT